MSLKLRKTHPKFFTLYFHHTNFCEYLSENGESLPGHPVYIHTYTVYTYTLYIYIHTHCILT